MGTRGLKLGARPVTWADSGLLHAWANDPLTRAMSFRADPIPLHEHERWLRSKLTDERCRFFLVLGPSGEPVGTARFDFTSSERAEISLSLAPEARGRRLATPAIEAALRALAESAQPEEVVAFIKAENLASLRAFERAGFGRHHVTARREQRVLRLTRALHHHLEDRLRGTLTAPLKTRLGRWRTELTAEMAWARAEAILLLAGLRPLVRRLPPDQRARWYRGLSQRHPAYFRTHSFLGHALQSAGQLEPAIEAFSAALRLHPGDPGALEGLLRACRRAGREAPLEVTLRHANTGQGTGQERRATLARLVAQDLDEEAERLSERIWGSTSPHAEPSRAALARSRAEVLRLSGDAPWAHPLIWALDEHVRAPAAPAAPRPSMEPPAPERARAPQMDVVKVLNELERELPVHEWSVNGVLVWPVLRAQLGGQLLAITQDVAPRVEPSPSPTAPTADADSSLFARWSQYHEHGRKLRPAEVLFVGFGAQRQLYRGRRYDRSFDPLRDVLDAHEISSLHLESVRDHVLQDVLPLRASVEVQPTLDRILRGAARRPLWQLRVPGWDRLAAQVSAYADALGPRLWLEAKPERWATSLGSLFETARYFDFVLDRVKPRLVFLTVYYSTLGFGLCLAAARRGIPVVDLQHGMTTRHYAYESWSRVPAAGYPALPSVFWAWTPRDAARVSAWSEACGRYHRAVPGGHPWNALLAAQAAAEPGLAPSLPPARRSRLTVLVSLNWSFGFADRFKELMRAADPSLTWWVRLHPIMRPQLAAVSAWCREHLRGPHEVETVTELPLDPLLRAADVHLTLSSSVTQEATRAGLPSVCLEPRSQWLYAEEIASGWVQYVSGGPSEILAALEVQAQRRAQLAPWEPFPDADHVAHTLLTLLDAAPRRA